MPVLIGFLNWPITYQPNSSIFTCLNWLWKKEIKLIWFIDHSCGFFLQSPPHHVVRRCLYLWRRPMPTATTMRSPTLDFVRNQFRVAIWRNGMGMGWENKAKNTKLSDQSKIFHGWDNFNKRSSLGAECYTKSQFKLKRNKSYFAEGCSESHISYPNTSGVFMAKWGLFYLTKET